MAGANGDSWSYLSQSIIRGEYSQFSGLYIDPGATDSDRYMLRNAGVTAAIDGDGAIAATVYLRDDVNYWTPLVNPAGRFVAAAAGYDLDQTIAQWSAGPWFAQLQVQTDPASNTAFRLCWHLRSERIIRLTCSRHDRATGAYRGLHITDDSLGLGPIIWATR